LVERVKRVAMKVSGKRKCEMVNGVKRGHGEGREEERERFGSEVARGVEERVEETERRRKRGGEERSQ
jgi:hypothetical protein